MMRKLVIISLFFFTSFAFANDLTTTLKNSSHTTQLILVIADNNQATQGILQRYARKNKHAKWQKVGDPFVVTLGRNGLAWDQNLSETIRKQDAIKQEGDRHSPMGIFALSTIFADESLKTKMPFFQLQNDTVCVDDEHSNYYNKILINSDAIKKDWNSGEQMHDYAEYQRGIVVQYNSTQTRHAGSCIFMHIKHKPATTGCTSMARENITTLIEWLNQKRYPVLVQVSQQNLKKLQPMLHQYFQFG